MVLPKFEYQPLDEGEFRLLWNWTEDHSELKHFKVNEAPPYYALSYTWGRTDIYRRIEVNIA
jgi:hypothetical protein